MFEFSKQSAIDAVLIKRFGHKDPDKIENLNEINIWYSADNEINEMGICVELKFDDIEAESYQVNKQGIIYSWGDAPIIDSRSQTEKLNLEKVYHNLPNDVD